MDKETREFYDKLGVCICCRKEKRAAGHVQCPRCLERGVLYQAEKRASATPEMKAEANMKRREAYNRRRDAGLCPYCGKPATHGIYCYEHSIKEKRHHQELAAKAKQARHDRGLIPDYRKANHLCLQCGAPIEDGNDTMYCNFHRAKMVEYNRMADSTLWKSFRFGRLLYETYQSGQASTRAGGV